MRGIEHHVVAEPGISRVGEFEIERIADPAGEFEVRYAGGGGVGYTPDRAARLLELTIMDPAPRQAHHRLGRPFQQTRQLAFAVPVLCDLLVLVVVLVLLPVENTGIDRLRTGLESLDVD